MRAIGLIETIGLVGAIEGLDTALKAANVDVIGLEFVGSGIVTVKINGEVDAVKASVEAAEHAVKRVGILRSTHVIPRASEDIRIILNNKTKAEVKEETEEHVEERGRETLQSSDENKIKDGLIEEKSLEKNKEIKNTYTEEELQKMKVSELRSMARIFPTDLTKKKIKFAKKEELVEAIVDARER